jgi:hypothetical protein
MLIITESRHAIVNNHYPTKSKNMPELGNCTDIKQAVKSFVGFTACY